MVHTQTYIKEKKDFIVPLTKQIEGFYKYYEELNKDKDKIVIGTHFFIKQEKVMFKLLLSITF